MRALAVTASTPEPSLIAHAAEVLRQGGLVAYPTDTLYALAADPRNHVAIARLFAAKGRAADAALPLIAASLAQAQQAGIFGARELRLADAFWPGPLTIVVPRRGALVDAVLAGGTTVAVRVPAHAVARALAAALDFCITATSANRSGDPPAATGADVARLLGTGIDSVDVLLDCGALAGGSPSTIVEMATDGPRLVRAGAVPWKRVLESLE